MHTTAWVYCAGFNNSHGHAELVCACAVRWKHSCKDEKKSEVGLNKVSIYRRDIPMAINNWAKRQWNEEYDKANTHMA